MNTNTIEGNEIQAARLALIRNHQLAHLTKDYKKSMDNTLRLYCDNQKIWRSKGRIGNSTLEEDAKNPIFIAPNTQLATAIIKETHEDYHKGIEHTIASIRQLYWIPKIRQQVRKIVSHCFQCKIFNGLPYHYPDTTDLPQRRVIRCHPFQHIGLDFFDLPCYKEGEESMKLYGCIFTCTATRMIHLELVRNMTTYDFLNALRRFIGRRGTPETITCDNAPTFLQSENILTNKNSQNANLIRVIANKEIEWKHITPYAPWQGSFYERLIKSIKHALHKTLRNKGNHSFDEMQTIIIEIEACLNSRPLTYQGSTNEELTSIRPIDFIQRDISLTLKLDNNLVEETDDPNFILPNEQRLLRNRQQVIDALTSSYQQTERFWNVWQHQYLTSLRETHKRCTPKQRLGQEMPSIGDVVLVCEPILPRNEWRMARITKVQPGSDGQIREAELITTTRRKIRRPVNLLIPLEIQDKEKQTKEQHGENQTEINEN
ncbi:unnamed protein product, partial [Cylicostephanus goldi]